MWKSNKKYVAVMLFIMTVSCQDKLDIEPSSEFTSASFYQSESDIELAVVGAYDALQSIGQYGQNFVYFMEVRSDNSVQSSLSSRGGAYAAFDIFNIEPTNTVLAQTWSSCYEGINRVNTILDRIEAVKIDENKKKNRIGEMYFLRGLTYFNLVRIWGDVPISIKETTDSFEAFSSGRRPVLEVYDQIILDMENAISRLPESTESGRPSKYAALALLAKVHIANGNFDLSIPLLEEVINANKYSIEPVYADIFDTENESNEEVIFEVQFTEYDVPFIGGTGEGSRLANLFAPSADLIGNVGIAQGDNLPSLEFYESYEIGDLRQAITVGLSSAGVLYAQKYIDMPNLPYNADNNFIVLRYADVILMLAEVLNESSFVADGPAFDRLNEIRSRAGLPELSSAEITDQAMFRDAVAKERRLELAFENHRWFDLVRTGKAIESLNGVHESANGLVSVQQHKLIFPIPQLQIDIVNNKDLMYQNPGY